MTDTEQRFAIQANVSVPTGTFRLSFSELKESPRRTKFIMRGSRRLRFTFFIYSYVLLKDDVIRREEFEMMLKASLANP